MCVFSDCVIAGISISSLFAIVRWSEHQFGLEQFWVSLGQVWVRFETNCGKFSALNWNNSGITTNVVMIKNITRFIPTSHRRKIKYEATIEPKCDSTCFEELYSNSVSYESYDMSQIIWLIISGINGYFKALAWFVIPMAWVAFWHVADQERFAFWYFSICPQDLNSANISVSLAVSRHMFEADIVHGLTIELFCQMEH